MFINFRQIFYVFICSIILYSNYGFAKKGFLESVDFNEVNTNADNHYFMTSKSMKNVLDDIEKMNLDPHKTIIGFDLNETLVMHNNVCFSPERTRDYKSIFQELADEKKLSLEELIANINKNYGSKNLRKNSQLKFTEKNFCNYLLKYIQDKKIPLFICTGINNDDTKDFIKNNINLKENSKNFEGIKDFFVQDSLMVSDGSKVKKIEKLLAKLDKKRRSIDKEPIKTLIYIDNHERIVKHELKTIENCSHTIGFHYTYVRGHLTLEKLREDYEELTNPL